jgi:hypothetical protein
MLGMGGREGGSGHLAREDRGRGSCEESLRITRSNRSDVLQHPPDTSSTVMFDSLLSSSPSCPRLPRSFSNPAAKARMWRDLG